MHYILNIFYLEIVTIRIIIIIMQLLKTFHRRYVNLVMIFDDITLI